MTFGSCMRATIMILLHSVIQRAKVFVSPSKTFRARHFLGVQVRTEIPLLALPKVYLKGAGAHRQNRIISSLDAVGTL